MSGYPGLREFIEGFADRYTRRTEISSALTVTEEELQTLSNFLVRGIVDWVGESGSYDAEEHPALGEFLDDFADQHPRAGAVGAVVQVTEDEMIGLGLFLARGFVGWVLRLDQNRGRFIGFDEVIERKGSSSCGPLSRRLVVGAI